MRAFAPCLYDQTIFLRKNEADSFCYQAEKQMEELGDKVPADEKAKLEGLVKELREAVAKEDGAEIQRIRPEAQQLLLSIGSNIYQQAGGGVPPEGGGGDDGGAGPTGGSGDDVIDAEFSETK